MVSLDFFIEETSKIDLEFSAISSVDLEFSAISTLNKTFENSSAIDLELFTDVFNPYLHIFSVSGVDISQYEEDIEIAGRNFTNTGLVEIADNYDYNTSLVIIEQTDITYRNNSLIVLDIDAAELFECPPTPDITGISGVDIVSTENDVMIYGTGFGTLGAIEICDNADYDLAIIKVEQTSVDSRECEIIQLDIDASELFE